MLPLYRLLKRLHQPHSQGFSKVHILEAESTDAVPTAEKTLILQINGLGRKVIKFPVNGSAADVKVQIEEAFTALCSVEDSGLNSAVAYVVPLQSDLILMAKKEDLSQKRRFKSNKSITFNPVKSPSASFTALLSQSSSPASAGDLQPFTISSNAKQSHRVTVLSTTISASGSTSGLRSSQPDGSALAPPTLGSTFGLFTLQGSLVLPAPHWSVITPPPPLTCGSSSTLRSSTPTPLLLPFGPPVPVMLLVSIGSPSAPRDPSAPPVVVSLNLGSSLPRLHRGLLSLGSGSVPMPSDVDHLIVHLSPFFYRLPTTSLQLLSPPVFYPLGHLLSLLHPSLTTAST
ncbi:unnamed protein product [Leuciscus chuanchicus]